MKKKLIAMSTTFLLLGLAPFKTNAEDITNGENPESVINEFEVVDETQEQEIVSSFTEVVEYNQGGEFKSKTIVEEGIPMSSQKQSRVAVGEGTSIDYKLIDKFNGSSKVIRSLSDWTYSFASAYIPEKFLKKPWSKAAATATLNALYKGSQVKYYTTKVYQTKDSVYYYGKAVSYEYSDSARTKLSKTITHISRVAK
ncbi:hypothetical protein [Gottfriedia acidiceleris]|uniref:hypothetical protein n=1 Tax=Gottfriedia acidiceleris TaxID=371036 RepID=UPI000B449284|nr:hypothetical protein [Gottfriedia acidiceleris]